MSPTLSWIQRIRPRSKWPPDDQDIACFAKHVGLEHFQDKLISDLARRLQTYSWRPGAYDSILIILEECSVRARISGDHKELGIDQRVLLLNHIKIWKPPDMQQPLYYCRDYQIMMGDRGVTGEIGEVITGPGEELMSSSQIKEKPPDTISLQQIPKQCTQGNYLNSKKRMKPDLLAIGTGQTVFKSKLFEKRGYNDDESLAKLELQQRNLDNCQVASCDIGAVRRSYLINQKELGHETNCIRNLTHQAITSSWNHVQSFSGERVMGSTTQVILSVPCLNFAEFRTSQTYLWRPGEHAKVSDYVFKSSFINDCTDMMHLCLSKEPCADYDEAWKHTRRNSKCEEDKRFKPPDLDQDKHQDVHVFMIIKEAPPDATFKPKPSRKGFGLMLLLYDKFLSANLFCVNEYESGLSNASGERRIKCISPFYITKWISNNAYHKGLQGKCKLISSFKVTNLVSFLADDPDLRTNLFEEGGDDMIMESSREWMQEPDYGELVAEDATRRIHWARMEALSFLYFNHHSSYTTLKLIIK